MSDNWFYAKDGQQFGPFAFEQFRLMAQAGLLSRTDMVKDDVRE